MIQYRSTYNMGGARGIPRYSLEYPLFRYGARNPSRRLRRARRRRTLDAGWRRWRGARLRCTGRRQHAARLTTKKVAFRDELGPRPWSMVTIRHVFWGLRGRSYNFFFRFRGLLHPRIGPKRGRWSSGPWSIMISRFRQRSQRKSVL